MCNQVHSVSNLRRIRQQYLNFIKTHPSSKDNANVASMFVQFLNNNLYSIVIFFLLLENNVTMSPLTDQPFFLYPVYIRSLPCESPKASSYHHWSLPLSFHFFTSTIKLP